MQLKVINSNSSGNAYILENESEALLIECGVRFETIKQYLGFSLKKVVGCIITHEHNDHCKAVKDILATSIDTYATVGTHTAMGTYRHHRSKTVEPGKRQKIGGFELLPFDVKHDCIQPVGYLIRHEDCGTVLFLTDTYYCEYTFPPLNNIIIEANYSQEILDKKLREGDTIQMLRDRVIESHMSLDTCKGLLQANDLRTVNNIVLIHLSDSNSNAADFKKQVQELTGKTVTIAEPGVIINFNKTPF